MTPSILQALSTHARAALALLVVLALAVACGGGVDSGGTGAPVQSFASGRISGFGSVIVNGVHFDDDEASIVDDDKAQHAAGDLQLGMTVDVQAGPISVDPATGASHAVATRVRIASAIDGPVQAVDAASSSLTVLGQPVKVDVSTVFANAPGGLADLHVGSMLVVYAQLDVQSGVYVATRVDSKSDLPGLALRGVVSALDGAAKTFAIGAAAIDYSGVPNGQLPALSNGAVVKVKLQPQQRNGAWLLSGAVAPAAPIAEDVEAQIQGVVANFAGAASFMLNDTPVDASGSGVRFTGGSAAQLGNGLQVDIQGTVHAGVLIARSVDIQQPAQDDRKIELNGLADSVDVVHRSFVVRGVVVVFDDSTTFLRGSAADLAPGVRLAIKGVLIANGAQVRADSIRIVR